MLAEVAFLSCPAFDVCIWLVRVWDYPGCNDFLYGFGYVVEADLYAEMVQVELGFGFAEVNVVLLKEVCIVCEAAGQVLCWCFRCSHDGSVHFDGEDVC